MNDNQLLLLDSLRSSSAWDRRSIRAFITALQEKCAVPTSTLKLNLKILREMGLIEIERGECSSSVGVTRFGKEVCFILAGNEKV